MTPIFKNKGERSDPGNYRPISNVSIISKIVEAVMKDQLNSFFESSNILSPSQFGYRTGRSAVKAVECLVSQILNAFENKEYLQATLCDLTKAFDTITHDIIIEKLYHYGIRGTELRLIISYLTNRYQTVSINNCNSQLLKVKCGVPQGSILGPLLFIIAVNDLAANMSSMPIIYVDDTTLVNSARNEESLKLVASTLFDEVSSWFFSNNFHLNCDKTERIIFTLNSLQQENLSKVKLLGITLDNKLNWGEHIQMLTSKLSRVIYLLRKLRLYVTPELLRVAYFAFFHSHLLYGIRLWGNATNIENIFKLQKKALRILAHAPGREHCKPIFREYKIMTVVSMYIFSNLQSLKSVIGSCCKTSEVHHHNTRNKNNLVVPFTRLTKCQRSYEIFSIVLFNKLPQALRDLDYELFVIKVKALMIAKAYYVVDEYLNDNFL